MIPRALFTAMGLVVAAAGCGDDGPAEPDAAHAQLTYHYQDSSVPPEYHRSYTLELTGADDGAHGELVVDSYGDELHRVDVDVEPDVWEAAVTDLAALDLSSSGTEDGCAGGTARSIELDADGERLVAADLDVCGGAGADAADELDAVVAPLLADLDMDSLLATD
jgi:hypothetical protein